jgi:hypothetical protein
MSPRRGSTPRQTDWPSLAMWLRLWKKWTEAKQGICSTGHRNCWRFSPWSLWNQSTEQMPQWNRKDVSYYLSVTEPEISWQPLLESYSEPLKSCSYFQNMSLSYLYILILSLYLSLSLVNGLVSWSYPTKFCILFLFTLWATDLPILSLLI